MELQIPCIMDQKKLCFIAVCVQSGDVLGTGLTQERALRISQQV